MDLNNNASHTIVPILACVLDQLCMRNDHIHNNNPHTTSHSPVNKFHALRPPAISIKDYLLRIAKYASCSDECFVLALVYIDRIIQSNPSFVVNSLNIHRLLITSIMLAAKFFDDQYYNNAYYAKIGGVPCQEMNALEVEFLFIANFTLYVSTAKYSQYYSELSNHSINANCHCSREKLPELAIQSVKYTNHLQKTKYPTEIAQKIIHTSAKILLSEANAHIIPDITLLDQKNTTTSASSLSSALSSSSLSPALSSSHSSQPQQSDLPQQQQILNDNNQAIRSTITTQDHHDKTHVKADKMLPPSNSITNANDHPNNMDKIYRMSITSDSLITSNNFNELYDHHSPEFNNDTFDTTNDNDQYNRRPASNLTQMIAKKDILKH